MRPLATRVDASSISPVKPIRLGHQGHQRAPGLDVGALLRGPIFALALATFSPTISPALSMEPTISYHQIAGAEQTPTHDPAASALSTPDLAMLAADPYFDEGSPLQDPLVKAIHHVISPLTVALLTYAASRYAMRDAISGLYQAQMLNLDTRWKRTAFNAALALSVPLAIGFSYEFLAAEGVGVSTMWSLWDIAVAQVESSLNAVHAATGLPWWATLAVGTIGLRVAVLPLNLFMLRNILALTEVRPRIASIGGRIGNETEAIDERMSAAVELGLLLERQGAHPAQDLFVPFVFVPTFLSLFTATLELSEHSPSLQHGGCLWFHDLSAADVTNILPAVSCLTWLWNVEIGVGAAYEESGKFRTACRALSLAFIPVVATMPSGVFCFWITSNLWEIARISLLHQDAVRDLLGLPLQKDLPPSQLEYW